MPRDIVKTIDLDRIAEDEENFLDLDKKKRVALKADTLKPDIKGVGAYQQDPRTPRRMQSFKNNVVPDIPEKFEVNERSIIGDQVLFNQGHVLKNIK